MANGEIWTQFGSSVAAIMFVFAIVKQFFPREYYHNFQKHAKKIVNFFNPYIQITFSENSGERFERSKTYATIEMYLATNSSTKAKRLKANTVKDSQSLVLSMDDYEEITDEFKGIRLWWASNKRIPKTQTISISPRDEESFYYTLTFHRRYRDIVTSMYLNHVLEEGKAVALRTRQRKLYTNNQRKDWGYRRKMWSHVAFEHPANFGTLALEPKRKQDIIDDLKTFSTSKEYYAKIGKAWKRGYLLYGPPGTGKSTMIVAMANLLEYDVYDLELTTVNDNTELKSLLIETSNKSIIVIEDIDCSLDLTGQRKNEKQKDEKQEGEEMDAIKKMLNKEADKSSKVTLSGLLNFIDGLWSACGEERIIVFTTNYVEKLDPALIRRGRMDNHIELSYCCFEAFKVLAKNYVDLDWHPSFDTIKSLLEETDMTPADVAENLMPKSSKDDADICLERLIKAVEGAKEEARLKMAEKEKKVGQEEEDTIKAEEK